MRRSLVTLVCVVALGTVPLVADAFPFGGRASVVLPCVYNSTIYANLGPPIGGEYIWTTATRTYQFGPPSHAGQWLLGLAGAPYYCVYSIAPLTIYSGIAIVMMGSSGGAAPPAPPTTGPAPASQLTTSIGTPGLSGTGSGFGSGSGSGSSGSLSKLVISEVYYAVDATHGTSPANQWVELYNGTGSTVNLSDWALRDNGATSTIPVNTTIASGQFAVLVSSTTTLSHWSIPASAKIVTLDSLGNGLSASSDVVFLRDPAGANIDAVSWGSDVSAFNPPTLLVSNGNSLARESLTTDTDSASDWISRATPTPGQ